MVVTSSVARRCDDGKSPLRDVEDGRHKPQAAPATYPGSVPRPRRSLPADLADGWPDTPSSIPEVETARQVAVNLRTALQGVSLRQAHRQTGVDHTTVAAILNGTVWPDLHTLARLEHGLGAALWPRSSRPPGST